MILAWPVQDARDALTVLKGEFEDDKAQLELQVRTTWTYGHPTTSTDPRPPPLQKVATLRKEVAEERKRGNSGAGLPLSLASPMQTSLRDGPLTQSSILERTISSGGSEAPGSRGNSTFTFPGSW
jgi:hypothetical protein